MYRPVVYVKKNPCKVPGQCSALAANGRRMKKKNVGGIIVANSLGIVSERRKIQKQNSKAKPKEKFFMKN